MGRRQLSAARGRRALCETLCCALPFCPPSPNRHLPREHTRLAAISPLQPSESHARRAAERAMCVL